MQALLRLNASGAPVLVVSVGQTPPTSRSRETEMKQQDTLGEPSQSRRATGLASAAEPPGDPGRTPGTAEGTDGDQSREKSPQEPGKTPGQAEGDLETVEDDLREKNRQ